MGLHAARQATRVADDRLASDMLVSAWLVCVNCGFMVISSMVPTVNNLLRPHISVRQVDSNDFDCAFVVPGACSSESSYCIGF